ncbi:MAG: hypothetical protein IPK93_02450 [Solirubrobacterales bacterium]|nr:hypothetical protein [Solirubrobacterales bacterium]
MADYFHVAPKGALTVGDDLSDQSHVKLSELQIAGLEELLGLEGVTRWGDAMLLGEGATLIGTRGAVDLGFATRAENDSGEKLLVVGEEGQEKMNVSVNRVLELVFELFRGLIFPEKPSRLNCVFAYLDLTQAQDYRAARRSPETHEIWRIQASDSAATHEGDSTWLSIVPSNIALLMAANFYWSGSPRKPTPGLPADQEVLLDPDRVEVVEMVTGAEG